MNAELIKAIRENEECNNCAISIHDDCNERKMSLAAADALEATEQRIAELSAQIPKEAHWVAVDNGHGVCSNCNRQDSIDNMATHCRYCGARMTKGEHNNGNAV